MSKKKKSELLYLAESILMVLELTFVEPFKVIASGKKPEAMITALVMVVLTLITTWSVSKFGWFMPVVVGGVIFVIWMVVMTCFVYSTVLTFRSIGRSIIEAFKRHFEETKE